MKALARLTFSLLALAAAGRLVAEEITVFASASLTDSLKEIGAAYEKETKEKVRFNFAESSSLAQQIDSGTAADIFFSDDEAKMSSLQATGLIARETRRDVLENSLVVITALDGPGIARKEDLVSNVITRISIPDPEAVPAGIYAKAWLKKIAIWETLQPKIVPGVNGRATMTAVESGNAEVGIVYKTDAAISDKVTIAFKVPSDEVPPIVYPVAMVKDARHAEAAKKFLVYLQGETATRTFQRFGFTLID